LVYTSFEAPPLLSATVVFEGDRSLDGTAAAGAVSLLEELVAAPWREGRSDTIMVLTLQDAHDPRRKLRTEVHEASRARDPPPVRRTERATTRPTSIDEAVPAARFGDDACFCRRHRPHHPATAAVKVRHP
jgi:hypothetical protein